MCCILKERDDDDDGGMLVHMWKKKASHFYYYTFMCMIVTSYIETLIKMANILRMTSKTTLLPRHKFVCRYLTQIIF